MASSGASKYDATRRTVSNLSAMPPCAASPTTTTPYLTIAADLGGCGGWRGGAGSRDEAALRSHGRGHRIESRHAQIFTTRCGPERLSQNRSLWRTQRVAAFLGGVSASSGLPVEPVERGAELPSAGRSSSLKPLPPATSRVPGRSLQLEHGYAAALLAELPRSGPVDSGRRAAAARPGQSTRPRSLTARYRPTQTEPCILVGMVSSE